MRLADPQALVRGLQPEPAMDSARSAEDVPAVDRKGQVEDSLVAQPACQAK